MKLKGLLKDMLERIKSNFLDGFVMSFFIISLTIIAYYIAMAFKTSEYGYLLEIKDFFNFAGVFGGAILGGLTSYIILVTTLANQKKQFEEQRNIDDQRRQEDKKQFELQLQEERSRFERQCKIALLNDKLDEYKSVYISAADMRDKVNKIELDIYKGVYKDKSSDLICDLGTLTKFRDIHFIKGLIIDNKEYKLKQNEIMRKICKMYEKAEGKIIESEIKKDLNEIEELLKEQLLILIDLISELNDKKYNYQ